MGFSRIDFFSSSFNFNIEGQKVQKGTVSGSIFTWIVIILAISYFNYLFKLYLQNEIEPFYRSQNIINNSTQSFDINQNIYAYKIENLIQNSSLFSTYLDLFAVFKNETQTQTVSFQTKDCIDPNLQGFQCLDQILYIDDEQKAKIENKNNKYKLTTISFYTMNCYDKKQDKLKCPPQDQINKVLDSSQIIIKLSLSQFNIQQKKMDQTFQTVSILTSADQQKVTRINLQNQYLSVKQGPFIQSELNYVAPFSYTIDNQSQNRSFIIQNFGVSPYSLVILQVDQINKQISIVYPTLPTILAQVNSVFNLLLFLGFFMKYLSSHSIQEQFFMVLIKNVYQEVYYTIFKINHFNTQNQQLIKQNSSLKQDKKAKNLPNEQQKTQAAQQESQIQPSYSKKKSENHKILEINQQISKDSKRENSILHPQNLNSVSQIIDINEIKNLSENKNLKTQSIGPRLLDLSQVKAKTRKQSSIQIEDNIRDKDICGQQLNHLDQSIKQQANFSRSVELGKYKNNAKIDRFIKKIIFGFKQIINDILIILVLISLKVFQEK